MLQLVLLNIKAVRKEAISIKPRVHGRKTSFFFLDILLSFRLSQRKKLYFEASFRKNFDISFRHEQIFIYFKNFIVP